MLKTQLGNSQVQSMDITIISDPDTEIATASRVWHSKIWPAIRFKRIGWRKSKYPSNSESIEGRSSPWHERKTPFLPATLLMNPWGSYCYYSQAIASFSPRTSLLI